MIARIQKMNDDSVCILTKLAINGKRIVDGTVRLITGSPPGVTLNANVQ